MLSKNNRFILGRQGKTWYPYSGLPGVTLVSYVLILGN